MSDFKPNYVDCWCGKEHDNPLTDFGHGFLTELRIPELAEWLWLKQDQIVVAWNEWRTK